MGTLRTKKPSFTGTSDTNTTVSKSVPESNDLSDVKQKPTMEGDRQSFLTSLLARQNKSVSTQRSDQDGAAVWMTKVRSADGKEHKLSLITEKGEKILRFEFQLHAQRSVKRDFLLRTIVALRVGTKDEAAAAVKLNKGKLKVSTGESSSSSLTHKSGPKPSVVEALRLYLYFIAFTDSNKRRLNVVKVDFGSARDRFIWEVEICRLLKAYNRPKNLLVFINPYGGKKKAPSIYSTEVAPVFDLVGLKPTIVTTERAHHVIDYLKSLDYAKFRTFDAIIAVGGDGLWNEVVTGAVFREQQELAIEVDDTRARLSRPQILLGAVPAGSTNSICHTAYGTEDAMTSALHIVLGHNSNIDLLSVHQGSKFVRFASLFVSFGLMGYALGASDKLRCLGPVRYEMSGVKTLCTNPSYAAKISYRPILKDYSSAEKMITKMKHEYMNLAQCSSNCSLCHTTNKSASICSFKESATPTYPNFITDRWTSVTGCVTPTFSRFSPYGLAPRSHYGDGSIDLALMHKLNRRHSIRFILNIRGSKGKHLQGQNMILLRVSRFSVTAAQELDQEQRSKFKDSQVKDRGSWNIDGEFMLQTAETVHVRVHRQLINMITAEEGANSLRDKQERKKTKKQPKTTSIIDAPQ